MATKTTSKSKIVPIMDEKEYARLHSKDTSKKNQKQKKSKTESIKGNAKTIANRGLKTRTKLNADLVPIRDTTPKKVSSADLVPIKDTTPKKNRVVDGLNVKRDSKEAAKVMANVRTKKKKELVP